MYLASIFIPDACRKKCNRSAPYGLILLIPAVQNSVLLDYVEPPSKVKNRVLFLFSLGTIVSPKKQCLCKETKEYYGIVRSGLLALKMHSGNSKHIL